MKGLKVFGLLVLILLAARTYVTVTKPSSGPGDDRFVLRNLSINGFRWRASIDEYTDLLKSLQMVRVRLPEDNSEWRSPDRKITVSVSIYGDKQENAIYELQGTILSADGLRLSAGESFEPAAEKLRPYLTSATSGSGVDGQAINGQGQSDKGLFTLIMRGQDNFVRDFIVTVSGRN